jgi:hypothetical protein
MTMREHEDSQRKTAAPDLQSREAYEAPEVKWLGSLDELTQGGSPAVSDGTGSAGSSGSI